MIRRVSMPKVCRPSRCRMFDRCSASLCFLVAATPLLAGDLTPPPGPVAPTPGPEPRIAINAMNTPGDDNSLFRITQPGSYYLESNIVGVAARHGIEIESSGVSIDLNGFELRGVPGSLDGIVYFAFNWVNINVRNGSVRSWGGTGVNILDGSVSGATVADIIATQNGSAGIRMGFGGTITRCTAYNNTGAGIVGASGTVITECVAYVNGDDGIAAGSGCTVARCTARSNVGDGISVFNQCNVLDNVCSLNGNGAGVGAGIFTNGNNNRIVGNNCTSADRGIHATVAGNFIARNSCSDNTTNWDIVAGNICLVVLSPAGAAINGNSGGTPPGSTDPNANFTY